MSVSTGVVGRTSKFVSDSGGLSDRYSPGCLCEKKLEPWRRRNLRLSIRTTCTFVMLVRKQLMYLIPVGMIVRRVLFDNFELPKDTQG